MKKVLLLTGAMLALSVAAASAQGINFSWDDCYLSGAANVNKANACNSNFGAPSKLIIALDPGAATIDGVNGAQGTVDLQAAGGALPDWWHLEPGGCRAGALIADVAVGSGNAPFSCPEPWTQVGGTAGGAQLAPFIGGADRARITWIVAVPGLVAFDPLTAPDWYIIALNITNAKTINTGACAGCLTPACLVANEIRLTREATDQRGDVFIYSPAVGQHVTWQGAVGLSCPEATPNQTNTWGQLKSLYR